MRSRAAPGMCPRAAPASEHVKFVSFILSHRALRGQVCTLACARCVGGGVQMKEFRGLLEQRRDGPDAVVTAAAAWAGIERALADEPAFAACPPPARLRVWLQVLKQLVDEEHAAWEAEDRGRLRKERKRALPRIYMPPALYTAHRSAPHTLPT